MFFSDRRVHVKTKSARDVVVNVCDSVVFICVNIDVPSHCSDDISNRIGDVFRYYYNAFTVHFLSWRVRFKIKYLIF